MAASGLRPGRTHTHRGAKLTARSLLVETCLHASASPLLLQGGGRYEIVGSEIGSPSHVQQNWSLSLSLALSLMCLHPLIALTDAALPSRSFPRRSRRTSLRPNTSSPHKRADASGVRFGSPYGVSRGLCDSPLTSPVSVSSVCGVCVCVCVARMRTVHVCLCACVQFRFSSSNNSLCLARARDLLESSLSLSLARALSLSLSCSLACACSRSRWLSLSRSLSLPLSLSLSLAIFPALAHSPCADRAAGRNHQGFVHT